MSWSVTGSGRPNALLAFIGEQFEKAKQSCKSNPHEVKSIEKAESLVLEELQFASEVGVKAVTVTAGGSAWSGAVDAPGTTQVSVNVTPIYGFQG